MVPAGNKAKRPSSVNHTTKTIYHHHHPEKRGGVCGFQPWRKLCEMQQWLQILISNETALSCCHRFEETIPSFLLGENLILPFFIFLYLALVVHFLFLLCIKHYIHSLDFGQFWLGNRENNIYITVKGLLVPKFYNV